MAFLEHLPPCVDRFYSITVDKKWTFLDYLPTSSCKRSLLTTPWSHSQEIQNSFKMFQKSSLFYTEYEHEQGKLGLQFFGLIWTLLGKINGSYKNCLKIDMTIDYSNFFRFSCILKHCVTFAHGLYVAFMIFYTFLKASKLSIDSI